MRNKKANTNDQKVIRFSFPSFSSTTNDREQKKNERWLETYFLVFYIIITEWISIGTQKSKFASKVSFYLLYGCLWQISFVLSFVISSIRQIDDIETYEWKNNAVTETLKAFFCFEFWKTDLVFFLNYYTYYLYINIMILTLNSWQMSSETSFSFSL